MDGAAFCPKCGAQQLHAPVYDEYEYAAFISYRHRSPDKDVAIRLHKALETYRLPNSVAQAYGAKKLGRVFRDQDELPATGSLPTAIREALKHSKSLVVVCSPATPESAWVANEIELCASYHGRDRIFAVLAEGKTRESLPLALHKHVSIEEEGSDGLRETYSEPLAADLRSPTAKGFKREALRIVAAIAGCSYDDLRQRDRSRNLRRNLIAVAISVLVLACFGIAFLQASSHRQEALVAESLQLAAESQQLFAQGDRYEAIETALRALPSSAGDTSRPLVPEAQKALENALEVYPSSSPWRSSYSLTTEHSMSFIGNESLLQETDGQVKGAAELAIDASGRYFAISDDDGAVNTYDLSTGRKLATCILPDSAGPMDGGIYVRKMCAFPDKLVISSPVSSGALCCFNPLDGTSLWSYENISAAGLFRTGNDDYFGVAAFGSDGSYSVGIVETETGSLVASQSLSDNTLPELGKGLQCAHGPRPGEVFFAIGDALVRVNVSDGSTSKAKLAYPEAASLACCGDLLVACTVEEYDGAELELHYAVEAFDSNLEKRWEHAATLSSEMVEGDGVATLVMGWPVVREETLSNGAIVLRVGRQVLAFDAHSGEIAYEHGFASTVLDVFPMTNAAGSERLLIASVDGTVVMENPESPTRNYDGDDFRLKLEGQLRWARLTTATDCYVLLAASATQYDRLVSYRTDLTNGSPPDHELTLDELIALADEQLANR